MPGAKLPPKPHWLAGATHSVRFCWKDHTCRLVHFRHQAANLDSRGSGYRHNLHNGGTVLGIYSPLRIMYQQQLIRHQRHQLVVHRSALEASAIKTFGRTENHVLK